MSDDIDDLLAGPRVLLIDLERVPGEVTLPVWEPRDFKRINWVHPAKWTKRPEMLCFGARWDDRKRAEFHASWDSDDPHHLARETWRLVNDCTHLVTYNGNRADVPWMKQAWLAAGLTPPKPYKHIDLYRVALQFGLPSKSLDELSKFLGLPGKRGHYDIDQARACLAGDEKARKAMRRYNLGDVSDDSLGGVWRKLRPWVRGLNLATAMLTDDRLCPYCTSANVVRNGWTEAATGTVNSYAAWVCEDCGGHSKSNIVKSRSALRGVS